MPSGDNSSIVEEHPRAYEVGRLVAERALRIVVPVLFVFGAIRFMGFRDGVSVLLVLLFLEVWFYGE